VDLPGDGPSPGDVANGEANAVEAPATGLTHRAGERTVRWERSERTGSDFLTAHRDVLAAAHSREGGAMSKHPSLIQEALRRLDGLRAYGVSRHALKAEQRDELRAVGAAIPWSHSTGRIHSVGTATTYQRHVLNFCAWARDTYGVRHLAQLDSSAPELVTEWLQAHLDAGDSPYTVQMQRSALRLFHGDRTLGQDLAIPRRRREAITRSRGPAADTHRLNLAHHQQLIAFLEATGLRRREVAGLRVGDIQAIGESWQVHVRNGKGGKERPVCALPGAAAAVRAVGEGRTPQERVFEHVPAALDVHAYRRAYAQALYCWASGKELPPASGRLPPHSYDQAAVAFVSRNLGHQRIDVVLRHYLR
jgi:integrase